jgi:hypothetical protein
MGAMIACLSEFGIILPKPGTVIKRIVDRANIQKDNAVMLPGYLDEEAVRERVRKRLTRLKLFAAHLVLTVAVCLTLTLAIDQAWLPKSVEGLIPIVVLVYIAHALWIGYQEASNFIVQQEIERERRRADAEAAEKPKRGNRLILDDDGELLEAPDEATEQPAEKSKRGG